jgi:hypothetical protein
MSHRIRSQKEEENGVESVIKRMVKGMRNEMNTVIWKIERSRDVSPEALKKMVMNGLDAMVGAVEKAMWWRLIQWLFGLRGTKNQQQHFSNRANTIAAH